MIKIDFNPFQQEELSQQRELDVQRGQAAQLAAAEQAASEAKEARRKLKAAWKAEMRRQDQEAREAGDKTPQEQRFQAKRDEENRLESELQQARRIQMRAFQQMEQEARECKLQRKATVVAFKRQSCFPDVVSLKRSLISSSHPLHKDAEAGDAEMVRRVWTAVADPARKNSPGKIAAWVAHKRDHIEKVFASLNTSQTPDASAGGA